MITILCSISKKENNDSAVPGLTHYILSAKLDNNPYRFARYVVEDRCLEIIDQDYAAESRIIPDIDKKQAGHSARYGCVSKLLAEMKPNDFLKAAHLSDLGENSSEAGDLYFSLLKKGIRLSVYDASYLDTDLHHLKRIPSEDQKTMITNMIKDYFSKDQNYPVLTKEEIQKLSLLGRSEKK